MLRSYLLFLLVRHEIGITKWADELYRVPLYTIISGFEPDDIPGIGTLYDFLSRFWASDENHLRSKKRPKHGKKGEKAPTSTGKVKRLVNRILRSSMPFRKQPFDLLLEFFQPQIVAVLESLGLLETQRR